MMPTMADRRPSPDFVTFETGEASATPRSVPMPWEEDDDRRHPVPPPRSSSAATAAVEVATNAPRRRLFVGRADEVREAEEALAPRGGIVTFFGLAGAGKTAVALELAHRAAAKRGYAGGVWWLAADGARIASRRGRCRPATR